MWHRSSGRGARALSSWTVSPAPKWTDPYTSGRSQSQHCTKMDKVHVTTLRCTRGRKIQKKYIGSFDPRTSSDSESRSMPLFFFFWMKSSAACVSPYSMICCLQKTCRYAGSFVVSCWHVSCNADMTCVLWCWHDTCPVMLTCVLHFLMLARSWSQCQGHVQRTNEATLPAKRSSAWLAEGNERVVVDQFTIKNKTTVLFSQAWTAVTSAPWCQSIFLNVHVLGFKDEKMFVGKRSW